MGLHGASEVSKGWLGDQRLTYRFWLLAHTVQNFSLKLSSATTFFSTCASLAPSIPIGLVSAGGGGGGGGTAAAACCLARSRGSAVAMLKAGKCRVLGFGCWDGAGASADSSAISSQTLVVVPHD